MSNKRESFADQIRRLIEASGKTRYRIGVETDIDHATISRFMNGKGGLSTLQLDALAELLGWKIVAETKTPEGRRRKSSKGK
jgi:transcriptional regulator with XRE-family HTH domain